MDGYIDYNKILIIKANIGLGQQGHMPMSKIVPPDSYIITVEWGQAPDHACDLDTYLYFGNREQTKVYYGNLKAVAPGTGGFEVTLDRDARCGVGPETVSFNNAGNCKGRRCLVKMKVDNYAKNFGDLGDSG